MTEFETLPFALPDVGDEEIEAVGSAIRTGWITSGPAMREFEQKFAAAIGGDVEAVAVNSATAGLHLALEAIGIGPGDEVLVPVWTFTATAEVVQYLGASPVFVDVIPKSLMIDFDDAAQKITPRTKAIIPVHFAGQMVSPQLLSQFAAGHGLAVIEDAAHAFPASRGGQLVGAGPSAATVFSFYATKTITTGEGGMVVTRDRHIAERIRTMRLHGISRDAFDRYRSDLPAWRYEVIAAGYKYNLTDPAAAMGLVQLRRAEDMRLRRQQIAAAYDEALTATCLELPTVEDGVETHSWHLYVVRLPGEEGRDAFVHSMARSGVGTSVHFIPLHIQPYWRDRAALQMEDFPVATEEFGRVVSLPIYSRMSNTSVKRVVSAATKAAT